MTTAEQFGGRRFSRGPGALKSLPMDIEDLMLRAAFLPQKEQAMVRFYLERRGSVRVLAELTGLHPGNVSRRCRSIAKRLASDDFGPVVRVSLQMSEQDREVWLAHKLGGRSQSDLARHRGWSRRRVRQTILKGHRLLEMESVQ